MAVGVVKRKGKRVKPPGLLAKGRQSRTTPHPQGSWGAAVDGTCLQGHCDLRFGRIYVGHRESAAGESRLVM